MFMISMFSLNGFARSGTHVFGITDAGTIYKKESEVFVIHTHAHIVEIKVL